MPLVFGRVDSGHQFGVLELLGAPSLGLFFDLELGGLYCGDVLHGSQVLVDLVLGHAVGRHVVGSVDLLLEFRTGSVPIAVLPNCRVDLVKQAVVALLVLLTLLLLLVLDLLELGVLAASVVEQVTVRTLIST